MKKRLTAIACLAAAALTAPTAAATAHDRKQDTQELAGGLVSPLHLAVGPGKSILVTQDFAGKLSRIDRDGTVHDLYQSPIAGWSVAGVEARGASTYFLTGIGAGTHDPALLQSHLKELSPRGTVRDVADLAGHEKEHNPDGFRNYGFGPEVPEQCLAQLPSGPGSPPARYSGNIDSNPYATAVQGNTAYVADAGANAVLKVNLDTGHVSTLAVLPSRPAVLPEQAALPESEGGLGMPACVVGHEYAFEPVPTDVEIGPDGWLYVSSLPGGPENPVLGARGAIFRINPWTGAAKLWVEGILSPTGIAVANSGDVYVASLFGNEILKFKAWSGHRSQFLQVPQPADVELHGRHLYASVDALGDPAAPPTTPPAGRVIEAHIR